MALRPGESFGAVAHVRSDASPSVAALWFAGGCWREKGTEISSNLFKFTESPLHTFLTARSSELGRARAFPGTRAPPTVHARRFANSCKKETRTVIQILQFHGQLSTPTNPKNPQLNIPIIIHSINEENRQYILRKFANQNI